jgi:hypothetical protein
MFECGVINIHLDLGEQRHDLMLGQNTAQLLLDQVTDHAFGRGTQHIERIRRDLRIGLCLQREQPHLGAVAMRDDDFVHARNRHHCRHGFGNILTLRFGFQRLTALQQGVAGQGNHDFHCDAGS